MVLRELQLFTADVLREEALLALRGALRNFCEGCAKSNSLTNAPQTGRISQTFSTVRADDSEESSPSKLVSATQ